VKANVSKRSTSQLMFPLPSLAQASLSPAFLTPDGITSQLPAEPNISGW
jgi:hypothetical protein